MKYIPGTDITTDIFDRVLFDSDRIFLCIIFK